MTKTRLTSNGALLAGDIGASNTRLALVLLGKTSRELSQIRTFQNKYFDSFSHVLKTYQDEVSEEFSSLSLGVAGPVIDGKVEMMNLGWLLDGKCIINEFGLNDLWLLNDLQANGLAIPHLAPDELQVLNQGRPAPSGNIAVISPGTGLGEAYLTNQKGVYTAHASEGGHSDFAPLNELQDELLSYLRKKFDHVSYERICSGTGLPNIYRFLKESGHAKEPAWLLRELSKADDPTPIIVDAALDKEKDCDICRQTLNIFIDILAAEAGNLALKLGSQGGLFIGGGIAPRILSSLTDGIFMRTFVAKGRYQNYLENISVQVILNPQAALLGAAKYGIQKMQETN